MTTGCGELAGAHARLVQNHASEVSQCRLGCAALLVASAPSDPVEFSLERVEHVLTQSGDRGREPLLIGHPLERAGCLAHVFAGIVGCDEVLHWRVQPNRLEVEQANAGHVGDCRLHIAGKTHVDHDLRRCLFGARDRTPGWCCLRAEPQLAPAHQQFGGDGVPLAGGAGHDDIRE